jgi:hypothetical protein
MKTMSLAVLVVCLFCGSAYSYDRTLITDQTEVGGYIAATIASTEMKDEFALLAGGQVAMVVNHWMSVGLGGFGTVVDPEPDDIVGLEKLELAYGGLLLEYIFRPHSVFHVSVPVLVGGGKVWMAGEYTDPESGEESDGFLVLEPGFNLEFNITRNWRLDFGIGYRHVSGTELADISDEELSGVTGVVTFKLGSF